MSIEPGKARLPDILDAQDNCNLLKKLRQRCQSSLVIGACKECRDMLDIYLDAELANENVQTIYPEVWAHLQRCFVCSAHYQRLLSTVRESRAGTLPSNISIAPPNLSFLSTSDTKKNVDTSLASVPWRLWIQSWLTGEPLRLHFVLSPYYLHNWQVQTQPLATRDIKQGFGDSNEFSRSLLLQTVPIGTQKIVVELKAFLVPERTGYVKLVASVDSNETLPSNLRLRLLWGGETVIHQLPDSGEIALGEFLMSEPSHVLQTNSGAFEFFVEPTPK